jgi:hypothetical protein
VLRQTFIHVPGVGERRERDLWRRGYVDWDAFLRRHPPGPAHDRIAAHLDPDRAARALPPRETWRLAADFQGTTAFLDVETTGLGTDGASLTCIGLSDGARVETFVRGRDLHRFEAAIRRFSLLVTYNGACFDLPVLQSAFPRLDLRRFLHVDLRYPLRRLGLAGGLKVVEAKLGLGRADEVAGADGFLAVQLWHAHRRGHPRALETLLAYCLEDVVNLKPLLAHAYNELSRALPLRVAPLSDRTKPAIPHHADGDLVRELLAQRGR